MKKRHKNTITTFCLLFMVALTPAAQQPDTEPYLQKRINAALTRTQLSYERCKVGLLRIYAEYSNLFAHKDTSLNTAMALVLMQDAPIYKTGATTNITDAGKLIWECWKKIKVLQQQCNYFKKQLNIHMPNPVGIPFFAENNIKTLPEPPNSGEAPMVHVHYAELGSFHAEQCTQAIEVIAELFITGSYIKKKEAER